MNAFKTLGSGPILKNTTYTPNIPNGGNFSETMTGGRSPAGPVTPTPPAPPTLTIAQVLSASAAQITAWKTGSAHSALQQVLGTFSTANGAALRADQVSAIGSDLTHLSRAGFSGLTLLAIAAIPAEVLIKPSTNGSWTYVISQLSPYQIGNLPTSTITTLPAWALGLPSSTPDRSILACLTFLGLGAISSEAFSALTVHDLMQASALTPNGQAITVLQALPWERISQLNAQVVGAFTASQLGLSNVQEHALHPHVHSQTLLEGLDMTQIQQLNDTTIQALSGTQLMQTNGRGVVLHELSKAQFGLLSHAQLGSLTRAGLAGVLGGHFNRSQLLARDQQGNLIFTIISPGALVSSILAMSAADSNAFITGLSPDQLQQLGGEVVNALIGSSTAMANMILNVGAPGSLSLAQFKALVTGRISIAQLNATILSKTLSVQGLLGMTPAILAQLTESQWTTILGNLPLAKVIYNAGSGDGYWTTEQLRAVSPLVAAHMTPDQYLQFTRGLSMFTIEQEHAMSANLALLEIMLAKRMHVWTPEQIAYLEQMIPGVILVNRLRGGGCGSLCGHSDNVGLPYQIVDYATMTGAIQLQVAISSVGWASLAGGRPILLPA